MNMGQSPVLLDFIARCPLDEESAAEIMMLISSPDFSGDELIFSLMDKVDFSQISSFYVLLGLSALYDGSDAVLSISDAAFNYLLLLFNEPNLFGEDSSFGLLSAQLVDYLNNEKYTSDWFATLLTKISEDDSADKIMAIFTNSLNSYSIQVAENQLLNCVNPLAKILEFVSYGDIRLALANNADLYHDIMRRLLSQTVFRTDSIERSEYFFGKDVNNVRRDNIMRLSTEMSTYHDLLKQIFSKMLAGSTRKQTFACIKRLISDASGIQRDGLIFQSPNSSRGLEAFAYNLECVLVRLAIIFRNKIATIPPYAPYLQDSVVEIASDTPLLAPIGTSGTWDSASDDTEFKTAIQTKEALTAAPQLFFGALKMMSLASSSFVRIHRQIARQLRHLEDRMREADPLTKAQMEIVATNLKMNAMTIEVLLVLPCREDAYLEFFLMALDYLQLIGGYDSVEFSFPPTPNTFYQHLPEFTLAAPAEVITAMYRIGHLPHPEMLLPRLAAVFSSSVHIRSPFVKHTIIQLFAQIASQPGENRHLVLGVPHVLEQMLPPVVEFFSAVQITGSHNEFYDKFEFRDSCQDLLKFWFRFSEFQEFFIAHCDERIYRDFVFHLVDDNLYYMTQSLSLFSSLKDIRDSDDPSVQSEVIESRGNLGYWMRSTNKAFELIESMTQFCPEVFEHEAVSTKFGLLTACSIQAFVYKDDMLTIDNPAEIGWDKFRFFSLVLSAVAHCTTEPIVHSFVHAEGYYSDEMLVEARAAMDRLGVAPSIVSEFELFLEMAFAESARMREEVIDTSDAPDAFLDPIMMEVMENPVRLPSGTVIDRTTYDQILLNNRLDPLTQTPIKEGDAVPADDIKAQIQEYLRRKRAK